MGGFDYPNGYAYEWEFMPEVAASSVIGVFAVIYVLMILFSFALSMASYVLHSYGLFMLAQRRGIRKSWLAWIPLGNLWILGSLSDQYQYLSKGKVKNRRKVLLGLEICVFIICMGWVGALLFSMLVADGITAIFGTVGGMLLLAVIVVILTVLQYMSYYDLFCSCQPSNGALYLILSILFSITLPIFVFICRKKDGGMPPRRQPQVVVEPEMPVQSETVVDVASVSEPEEGYAQPEEFEE